MANLEARVERLEERLGGGSVNGRDQGLVSLLRTIAENKDEPFDEEAVPVGFTVKMLLAEIDGRSTGLPHRHGGGFFEPSVKP